MKIGKIILIIVGNILIFYVLSELTLGFLGLPKEYHYHTFPPMFQEVTDKAIGFVNLPSTSINYTYYDNPRGYFRDNNTVEHVTNSYGFRGPQFSIQKASDAARIIFLGNSFTFGAGVYFNDTYPEQFQKMAEATHLFGNKKVEVINLGVSGYGTAQEWALLKDFAYRLKPDLIVIGYVLNDPKPELFKPNSTNQLTQTVDGHMIAPFVTAGMDAAAPPSFFDNLNNYSRLSRILTELYIVNIQNVLYYKKLFADTNPSWQESKKDIQHFETFSKTNHVPIVTILFPLLYRLDNYPFTDINQKIIAQFTKADIPTINLVDNLKGRRAEDLWVYPTDQHPNEIVHKIAAQALVKELQTQHIITN